MTTKWFIHMGMLGICSMEDLREKKISLWKIRLYAAVVLIYEIGRQIGGTEKISEWLIFVLTGLLPGIGMLIMGRAIKGSSRLWRWLFDLDFRIFYGILGNFRGSWNSIIWCAWGSYLSGYNKKEKQGQPDCICSLFALGNGRYGVMERKIKGSYTVEMAMISGVWLLILFASLLLLLGSYQRVWDTAGACEIAVYGSTMAVTEEQTGWRKQGRHQEQEKTPM